MGEGLLCGCSQTLELPATGGHPGPIFAVLLKAGEDLSLQASFPSVTGCLSGFFVVPYYFECVLMLHLFFSIVFACSFLLFRYSLLLALIWSFIDVSHLGSFF